MNATGTIHAGKRIKPGGRYDRFLTYLRAHPGATTREICRNAEIYAFTPTVSELRKMGYVIGREYVGTTENGAKLNRYHLIKGPCAVPVARQETQQEGDGKVLADAPAPSADKELF